MCGRFAFVYSYQALIEEFGEVKLESEPRTSYNIAPQQDVSVIFDGASHDLSKFVWGFNWGTGTTIINSRVETIFEKPMFKKAVQTARCIIPSSGYFEWKEISGKKNPYYIRPTKGYLGLAGIYHEIEGKNHFSIITTAASKEMSKIHSRMPVILKKKNYDQWLDKNTAPDSLPKLMTDIRSNFEPLLIGKEVNNPKNNYPELITPVQQTLF